MVSLLREPDAISNVEESMPQESQISFHHLTIKGWIESDAPPPDTVETWTRTVSRSVQDKLTINYERNSIDPAWSKSDVKSLRDSFLPPEAGVSATFADI